MTTTFSVHKQNINTYGPITSSYDPTTQKTTIPISSSDVTQSGSETRTSRSPPEPTNNKRTTPQPTSPTLHSVYTHKFPRHHFDFSFPFDDDQDPFNPIPKNQKESASEKKPQRVQNTKFAYEQGSDSNTNVDYSSDEIKDEQQAKSSNEEEDEEEKPNDHSKGQKSPFYDFFHSDDSGEATTPKPKRQQKTKERKEEDSGESEEGSARKTFFGSSTTDDRKFEDIPNPFADPNFDFNGYLQQLRASQAAQQQQLLQQQQQQQQQRTPHETKEQRRIIHTNQALPQNVYRPYRPYSIIPVQEATTLIPTTLNPYIDYQTTYTPDETIRHLETSPVLPLVIRNALKTLNGGNVDQPYHSHTALKPVQTKPSGSTIYSSSSSTNPTYKSGERGPQTFKNSHILAYNVNTQKSAFKPGLQNNQKSTPKVQVKQVPVVATDDYYYYYYDDEPQPKQQVKSSSANNKVEVVNKKPADDEYYYYEYYEYPDEKNKTKPTGPIRYDYVQPNKNNKNNNNSPPVNNKSSLVRNPYSNPNSLPSQNHNTYKSPNDNTNFYTIKPVHIPLTTTPYPLYIPNQKALYTTARTVTTVQPTGSYNRQRLTTTTDRDSRHDQPIFYNR